MTFTKLNFKDLFVYTVSSIIEKQRKPILLVLTK